MKRPSSVRFLASALLLVAGTLIPASAQPAAATDALTFSSSLSYSATTDLDRAGTPLGDVAVTSFQFSADAAQPIGERARLGYGLDYSHLDLARAAVTPLPGELQSLALPLSLSGPLTADWFGRLLLKPGLYGSSLALSGHSFNIPVVALASYRQNAALTWTVGLRYDAWSRYPVLPLAGVRWAFAPDWDLSIGLPRTGVSWEFHPHAILRLGASFQGGSYDVRDDPRPTGSTAPALGRTTLDYREIRVGPALELFSREAFSVVLDGGVIANQRFDYDRSDYRIEGDRAAYATLSARARF